MTQSTGQIGVPPQSVNNLDYAGNVFYRVPVTSASRDPTVNDRNYATSCEWSNTVTLDIWKLYGFNDGDADWRLLSSGGGGGGIQTLSDNSDVKTSPDGSGNVKLATGPGLTTTAGVSTITIDLVGGGIATESINVDAHAAPGTDPVVPDAGGQMVVTGAQTAPGTISTVVRTNSLAANTYTIEVQQTSTSAAKSTVLNGVAHFNSAQFTNDQGFISAIGGVTPPVVSIAVDDHTAPGTDPVVADGSAVITMTGSQVAAGLVGANVIRTDSLSANTLTIEIQRSDVAAISDPTLNGVAHFNSTDFTIDVDGFVSLNTPATNIQGITVDASSVPGTNPVLSDGSQLIAITGGQVASGAVGANVIRTDSVAANQLTVEIQRSNTSAATDSTLNGVSHFNSADFTIDPSGFVSLAAGSARPVWKLYLSTNPTNVTGDNTAYAIPFDVVSIDTAGGVVGSTYVIPTTGIYHITTNVRLTNLSGTQNFTTHFLVNGTIVDNSGGCPVVNTNRNFAGIVSNYYSLTAGDVLSVTGTSAGGGKTVGVIGLLFGAYHTWFSGALVT